MINYYFLLLTLALFTLVVVGVVEEKTTLTECLVQMATGQPRRLAQPTSFNDKQRHPP